MPNKDLQHGKFLFYQVPKALFTETYIDLSIHAMLLYAILLDLKKLSEMNATEQKWRDKNGDIFVFLPQRKIQFLLRCKHDKINKIIKELEKHGLIRRNKMGCCQCDQIVVLPVQDCAEKQIQIASGIPHSFVGISASNNNDNSNNNDINITDFQNVFNSLYDMYPIHRRGNKEDGYRAFFNAITTYEQALLALGNCSAWCKSAAWTNDSGKFVPQLANFFKKGYWDKKPPNFTSTIWGSGDLGDAERAAIRRLMEG